MFSEISFRSFSIFISVIFLFGLSVFFAYTTGWYKLAQTYETDLQLSDDIASRIRNYRCQLSRDIKFSVSEPYGIAFMKTGMYVNSNFPFIGVTPSQLSLLIPWQEINKYELVEREYRFYFGSPTISILILNTDNVKELEQLSGILISDRLNNN